MCGGGGYPGTGGSSGGTSASQLAKEAEENAAQQKYEEEINSYLIEELKNYNIRDTESINRHIDEIISALEKEMEIIGLLYGGSISRYTYINGLSDVDLLVILNEAIYQEKSPQEVLKIFSDRLKERFPYTTIKTGEMAVTISFTDGHEIQILPAIRTQSGVIVSDPKSGSWSQVVHPERFAQKLTEVNTKNNRRVVPVIKLIKSINAQLPAENQLTGYHIESLAIKIFNDYAGKLNHKDMLIHFYNQTQTLILHPINDPSGQSLHIDDYLKVFMSKERIQMKRVIEKIYDKLKKADSKKSQNIWKEVIEHGNIS